MRSGCLGCCLFAWGVFVVCLRVLFVCLFGFALSLVVCFLFACLGVLGLSSVRCRRVCTAAQCCAARHTRTHDNTTRAPPKNTPPKTTPNPTPKRNPSKTNGPHLPSNQLNHNNNTKTQTTTNTPGRQAAVARVPAADRAAHRLFARGPPGHALLRHVPRHGQAVQGALPAQALHHQPHGASLC